MLRECHQILAITQTTQNLRSFRRVGCRHPYLDPAESMGERPVQPDMMLVEQNHGQSFTLQEAAKDMRIPWSRGNRYGGKR